MKTILNFLASAWQYLAGLAIYVCGEFEAERDFQRTIDGAYVYRETLHDFCCDDCRQRAKDRGALTVSEIDPWSDPYFLPGGEG